MIKNILILMLTYVISQLAVSLYETEIDLSQVITSIEPYDVYYTFFIEHDGSEGKAFIADHKIHTAKHIYDGSEFVFINKSDYLSLGESKIEGLHICHEPHVPGDKFSCFVQNGYTKMFLDKRYEFFYAVNVWPPVIPGDSGSPVFCDKHHGVVGIISGTGGDGSRSWISVIPNERKAEGTKEDEKEKIKPNK